ncbi:hypothetical protein J3B02_005046, partial [Coemansia erecta]
STLMFATPGYAAGQHSFIKRLDTARALDMKGAILFKDTTATTCEVALVSNLIGYVSANCLDFEKDTTTLNNSTSYSVMLSDSGTTTLGKYNVDTITVHPKYDPKTFANNLALLQFNSGNPLQFKNYIAANEGDWLSTMYVRRGVVTSAPNTWSVPQVANGTQGAPDKCAQVSALYEANTNDLMCTEQILVSDQEGKKCAAPFGSIYGVHDPDLAIAGLYSHSVIVGGDNLCNYGQVYSFYTLLSNYLEWGGNTAQSTMYLFVANQNYLNNVVSGYSMKVPTEAPAVSGLVVGGDLSTITILGTVPADSESSSATIESARSTPAPTSSTSASSTPSSSSSSAEESSSSEGGLDKTDSNSAQETENKGKKSNIVTIVIIVLAILAVLAIIAYLWWRRRRNQKKKQNVNMIDIDSNNYDDGAQIDRPSFIGGTGGHLHNEIMGARDRDSSYSGYSRSGYGKKKTYSEYGLTAFNGNKSSGGNAKIDSTYA